MGMVQILQSFSYKVNSIFLQEFVVFVLFILVLDTSTIILKGICCYAVTTRKICLYRQIFHDVTSPKQLKKLKYNGNFRAQLQVITFIRGMK